MSLDERWWREKILEQQAKGKQERKTGQRRPRLSPSSKDAEE